MQNWDISKNLPFYAETSHSHKTSGPVKEFSDDSMTGFDT